MGPRIAVGSPAANPQSGFTYLGLLIFVAVSSLALAATFEVWHTLVQREKEAELLFIGNEFRNALKGYYDAKPANVIGQPVRKGQRPRKLDELVADDRFATPQRWLRRIYVDPMTGNSDWGLVTLPDGQISGVHSLSDKEPMKKGGFLQQDSDFADKTSYADWVFSPKLKAVGGGGGFTVYTPPTPLYGGQLPSAGTIGPGGVMSGGVIPRPPPNRR